MNIFRDQEKFMRACDQTVDAFNADQFNMYLKLIEEESQELGDAIAAHDKVEILDALIDMLVVTIGAIHSAGFDAEGAWKEVMRTNFAKIDKKTGKVRKREDGKVLKPLGWTAPNLEPFVTRVGVADNGYAAPDHL
jgi:predicted HAD superfamily Cof-like phosphohydrolase